MNEEQIKEFEQWKNYCESEKDFFVDWGSPLMNEALRGARGGMSILVGGMANTGKTSLITSTVLRILEKNDDRIEKKTLKKNRNRNRNRNR